MFSLSNYSQIQSLGLFTIHGTIYTYRIGIVNTTELTLRDVEVRLINLSPCPHDFNAIGGHLHWEHDNPPEGQPNLTRQSIPPTKLKDYSDARFVDVMRCFWPDKEEERGHTKLQICHVIPGVSCVVAAILPYKLIITAHDQEKASVSEELYFNPLGDGPPKLSLCN